MAKWLAEAMVVAPNVYFCGSLRTSAKKSLRLSDATLGVVLTISRPSARSATGVKSRTTS
jgi:hypothetical protein